MSYHNSPVLLHYLVKLLCSEIVNYIVGLYYKRLMTMNNYTIKSFVVLIRTF